MTDKKTWFDTGKSFAVADGKWHFWKSEFHHLREYMTTHVRNTGRYIIFKSKAAVDDSVAGEHNAFTLRPKVYDLDGNFLCKLPKRIMFTADSFINDFLDKKLKS